MKLHFSNIIVDTRTTGTMELAYMKNRNFANRLASSDFSLACNIKTLFCAHGMVASSIKMNHAMDEPLLSMDPMIFIASRVLRIPIMSSGDNTNRERDTHIHRLIATARCCEFALFVSIMFLFLFLFLSLLLFVDGTTVFFEYPKASDDVSTNRANGFAALPRF